MGKNIQSKRSVQRPKSAASMAASWRPLSKIKPNPSNVRLHSDAQLDKLAESIRQFGQVWPILVDKKGVIVAHHGVYAAMKRAGYDEAKVTYIEGLTPEQTRAFVIADNRLAEISSWDEDRLRAELTALAELGVSMSAVGYAEDELAALMEHVERQAAFGSLAESFGVPPFTVLNARSGDWQRRKDAWLSLGIKSEEGRGDNLIGRSPQELFCFETGMAYETARRIVTDAMAAQGDAFDLGALIDKHRPKGRRNARFKGAMKGGPHTVMLEGGKR